MTDFGRIRPAEQRGSWLPALRTYVAVLVPLMLVWETAQMPLYTLWQTGTVGEIAYAIVHCTLGDALIGLAARWCWSDRRSGRVPASGLLLRRRWRSASAIWCTANG
jgi:hypothetical protein